MSSTEDRPDDSKAARMMRRAILHELHQPPAGPDDPEPADMLQQVARALVQKAGQGDVSAIKEVLDRIDGRTPPGVADGDSVPSHVNFTWKPPA
jgi:hypothetical protein